MGIRPIPTVVKTYNIGSPNAEDVTATLYSDGLLEFDGTGDMEKYYINNGDYKYAPWMDNKDNIKSISFKQGNTIKPTSTSLLFAALSEVTFIDISNLDSSNVTDMRYMFTYCKSIDLLDLSNLDTSSVTNMDAMFDNCSSLTSLNISGWNTSNVTDMSYMFNICSSLTEIIGLENLNTSNITYMEYMFNGCSSLTSLELSSFDTSNVTSMGGMFGYCIKLNAEIIIKHKLNNYSNIFKNCSTESGSEFVVNYNNATKDYIDTYIATKSENSNVIKGINIDETIA